MRGQRISKPKVPVEAVSMACGKLRQRWVKASLGILRFSFFLVTASEFSPEFDHRNCLHGGNSDCHVVDDLRFGAQVPGLQFETEPQPLTSSNPTISVCTRSKERGEHHKVDLWCSTSSSIWRVASCPSVCRESEPVRIVNMYHW